MGLSKVCGTCQHFPRCKSDLVIGARAGDMCHWGSGVYKAAKVKEVATTIATVTTEEKENN